MAKKKYLKLEYMITLLIIIAVVLIIVPFDFENNTQAEFISRWQDKYSRLEYMFNVISAHEKAEILKSFQRAKTPDEREQIMINVIKPYFRIKKENLPKHYIAKFMNKIKVPSTNKYYFDDIYTSENGMIVGIKDLECEKPDEPMFLMMFDINGVLPPNTWGKDVFGAKIYSNKVEPLGQDLSLQELKNDCSENGKGIGCSYYYQIGGNFSD